MTNFERIKSLDDKNLCWFLSEICISRDQLEAMSAREFYELLNKNCYCFFLDENYVCRARDFHSTCSDGIKKYLLKLLGKCCINWLNQEEVIDD